MEKQYKIEKLDHQGRGMIKEDGLVVFVENALPNETVKITITKEKKNLKEAVVTKYENLSSTRIQPFCPYYSLCGGCHIMHIPYEKQLEWKEQKVKEIMQKFMDASIDFPMDSIVASEEKNYRNKATFQVKEKIGYFGRKSNHLIPIEHCDIVDFKINQLLPIISKLEIGNCSQIIVRASKNTDQTMVVFQTEGKIDVHDVIEKLGPHVSSIYIKQKQFKCIYGTPYIEEKIGDIRFKISPDSFFQINTNQAKKLYDIILAYASLNSHETVLDLYCGTGSIGLYLSQYCHKVYGIEINEQAIKDAKENQKYNHMDNLEFVCGDVSHLVNSIHEIYDVVIVDPPRNGLN